MTAHISNKAKPGRPGKGGGRLNLRLSAHARALLTRHTSGQSFEGEDGSDITVAALPSYPTMTAMVEHGIVLAARRDLVPRLDDAPEYRASRQRIRELIEDLSRNVRIALAIFHREFGVDRSRWSASGVRRKRLINSLIWTRGRLIIALAVEDKQPAPPQLLRQLRALACEDRELRIRR